MNQKTQTKKLKTLADLRQEAKLTQEELAEKLGVTSTTVANWENGRTTPRFTIFQLNDLMTTLSCSWRDLLEISFAAEKEKKL